MANSSVPITAGSGTEIDTRTTTTDTNHRQVIVIGDPATDAGVAPVDATSGLKVNLGADNDVTVTSGAITETNSTAILADTASMDTNLTTLAGAVTGTEMQVDVVTSALPSGAATSAAQLPDGHNVTIDNSTGAAAVNIQDGGNTITVDGTVTANPASGTIDTVTTVGTLTTITNDVNIADGGNFITVDNGGTFATQATLQSNSGVDIGDVDVTSQPDRDRTTDNVGVALQTDAIMSDTTAITPQFAVISAASSGDNTLVAAAGASNKIRVLSYTIIADGDVDVRFESGAAGTALTGQMALTTNSGVHAAFNPVGHFETAANTLLNLELSGAIGVNGHITYIVVT